MELSELAAYAREKYNISEERKWADMPGLSVLCHPRTGRRIARLMRQWDEAAGETKECCDLNCGSDGLERFQRPYLSQPIRMLGSGWINIAFDERTEAEVVFELFDKAVASDAPSGCTIFLASELPLEGGAYRESPLPFAGSRYRPPQEDVPERIREMRRLYVYGRESEQARAQNFYRQAVFMEDYEDDRPWTGLFSCYFPTYHDMTVRQLRGYFSWRTQARRGNFQPIDLSAAYVYIYELLNDIGIAAPEEALRKLNEFETGFLDAGLGDSRMRRNLHRWKYEYAILKELPPESVRELADPEQTERDAALEALRDADNRSDEEVLAALCRWGGKKTALSSVLTEEPERGGRLFCEAWRKASADKREGRSLFVRCFGKQRIRRWEPLSNAVYYERSQPEDREYALNGCRSYRCRNGRWHEKAFDIKAFNRTVFQGFLHETEARLRVYLKIGRTLKEQPADEWAVPYIEAAIEEDKRARLEAARQRIRVDLSGLEQIRREAAATRDSLLTEEETEEAAAPQTAAEPVEGQNEALREQTKGAEISAAQADTAEALGAAEVADADEEEAAPPKADASEEASEADADKAAAEAAGRLLNSLQMQIARSLLQGNDVSGLLRARRLTPSMAADEINEALFDEIGDNVLICEDDRLTLVEDYLEDLEQLLGGCSHD